MAKENLVVIFGGRSSEHEVSCISVQTVAKGVDLEKYNMTLVGITKDGRWLKADNIESIADGSWYDSKVTAVISPDTRRELIVSPMQVWSARRWTSYSLYFTVCMARMELYRDCSRWQIFHMLDVAFWHRQHPWINSIRR